MPVGWSSLKHRQAAETIEKNIDVATAVALGEIGVPEFVNEDGETNADHADDGGGEVAGLPGDQGCDDPEEGVNSGGETAEIELEVVF